ncbi:MAG: tRNA 2-thiocytidine(32) synthetase TtcA [Clostridia bacterium]|nr:tRNA 2-thiocytidine(32) synthetase TtcA [Clostridia bacterium]
MADRKKVLSAVRRACEEYRMIEPGDRIAVGLSGGKDSITLLVALAEMRRFYPAPYELIAITADLGFPGGDFSAMEELCRSLDVPYVIERTEIARIVFDERKETNPCSLCAKMRRGAIHSAAKRLGCGKVAFAHHFDDVAETFLLNLFHEGRLGAFQPVTYLDRTGVTLIRPLIFLEEKEIRSFVKKEALPVLPSLCPADKHSEREEMKELLRDLERRWPELRQKIFTALRKSHTDGY